MPIKVAESDQAPALGAAIYAAVAAGVYKNVIEASKIMGSDFEAEYFPQADYIKAYTNLKQEYEMLGEFIESNIKTKKYEFQI
jgi:L-ribulokinase